MGIYGDEKDYEQLVKDNIEKAKLLYDLNDEGKKLMEMLLIQKEKIRNKNGIFASLKINRINKKIDIIRSKYRK